MSLWKNRPAHFLEKNQYVIFYVKKAAPKRLATSVNVQKVPKKTIAYLPKN
jgi:Tfp pilus assembly protein PilE